MPISPLAAREKRKKRGRASSNAVVAGNLQLVADSGVPDRPLTLEEARDLAVARPVATRSEFRPSTLKKNMQFLRKYVTVNAREDVDETGLESLLQALFVQQSHTLGRGVRAMTAESMVDNICRVGARMWRAQNKSTTVPGTIHCVLQRYQRRAHMELPRSLRTLEFDDEAALLFMAALPREYSNFAVPKRSLSGP